jgi:hypothetical protein
LRPLSIALWRILATRAPWYVLVVCVACRGGVFRAALSSVSRALCLLFLVAHVVFAVVVVQAGRAVSPSNSAIGLDIDDVEGKDDGSTFPGFPRFRSPLQPSIVGGDTMPPLDMPPPSPLPSAASSRPYVSSLHAPRPPRSSGGPETGSPKRTTAVPSLPVTPTSEQRDGGVWVRPLSPQLLPAPPPPDVDQRNSPLAPRSPLRVPYVFCAMLVPHACVCVRVCVCVCV